MFKDASDMIRVACPHCSKALGLPPSVAGKTVKCPNCKQLFAAPAATPAKAVVVPAGAARQPAPVHHDDEYGEATPYGIKHEPPPPAAALKSASVEAVD